MKTFISLIAITLALTATSAYARDDFRNFSIKDALASEQAKSILGDNVKFYFGDTKPVEKVTREVGEFRVNRKTNASNKSDEAACQWVFLTVLKELRNNAQQNGGNAVINIKSNYKNNLTSNNETFMCGAGALMAGVALVGDVVVLQ